jgi:hypothetical protein
MLGLGEVEPPTVSVLRRRRVLPRFRSGFAARASLHSYVPRAACPSCAVLGEHQAMPA